MPEFVADVPPAFLRFLAFAFGAAWGSFFNVAIYRWPREMSVVSPPSHCPACAKPIEAWRNLPLLGWLVLRGRTACCGARLSPRYFVVELLTACVAVAVTERVMLAAPPGTGFVPAALETAVYFFFLGGLIIATFVDFEWMEIPDEVSLPGTALGLLSAPVRAEPGVENACYGAGGAFLVVELGFVWLYERVLGRRGMGQGDAKLLMMIGAFLGWQGALFALLAGSFQGIGAAIVQYVRRGAPGESSTPHERAARDAERAAEVAVEPTKEAVPPPAEPSADASSESAAEDSDDSDRDSVPAGQMKIPFGPFLALGAVEYFFFGDALIDLWFRVMGG